MSDIGLITAYEARIEELEAELDQAYRELKAAGRWHKKDLDRIERLVARGDAYEFRWAKMRERIEELEGQLALADSQTQNFVAHIEALEKTDGALERVVRTLVVAEARIKELEADLRELYRSSKPNGERCKHPGCIHDRLAAAYGQAEEE